MTRFILGKEKHWVALILAVAGIVNIDTQTSGFTPENITLLLNLILLPLAAFLAKSTPKQVVEAKEEGRPVAEVPVEPSGSLSVDG